MPVSLSSTLNIPAPSDDTVLKKSIEIKSSLPVYVWYITSAINGDLQECVNFILLHLLLLGIINKYKMWKR